MIDCDRRRASPQLPGVDQEHRAALQIFRNPQVVARRQRIDLGPRAMHDDSDGLRSRRQVIGEIGAQPRAVRGFGHRRAHTEIHATAAAAHAAIHWRSCERLLRTEAMGISNGNG